MALALHEASAKGNLHYLKVTEQIALAIWEGVEAPQPGLACTSTTARESLHVSALRVVKHWFSQPIFRDIQGAKLLTEEDKQILGGVTHVEVLMCKACLDFLFPSIIFLIHSFLLLLRFNCQKLENGGGRK